LHAFQAQGHPAKICCGHVAIPNSSERVSYLTVSGWHMSTARGRIMGNLEGCFRIADHPPRMRLRGLLLDSLGISDYIPRCSRRSHFYG
jgi:hypothetical protein